MSEPIDIQQVGLGKEIEIIRQRFFIDHTSKSNKVYSEEYTLVCRTDNPEGIDNIFLKIPKLLPNLRVYDSDSSELALITNHYTKGLIRYMINTPKYRNEKSRLEQLLDDIENRRYWILWIKLPHYKKMKNKEGRIITLQYEAKKGEIKDNIHFLEFHSLPHEVFYIITRPEEYSLDKENVIIIDTDGTILKKQDKDWDNQHDDPFFRDEQEQSITYRVKPDMKDQIEYSYSFKPIKHVINIPKTSWWLLISASMILFASKIFQLGQYCIPDFICVNFKHLVEKDVEIGVGIIAASLIIATLISNQDIRHTFRYHFFISIVLSILAIIINT
ncbi:MAG: hypothetical protein WEB28_02940 [Nitrosopumilaceae archaeon]